jgi:hypothetical protein
MIGGFLITFYSFALVLVNKSYLYTLGNVTKRTYLTAVVILHTKQRATVGRTPLDE